MDSSFGLTMSQNWYPLVVVFVYNSFHSHISNPNNNVTNPHLKRHPNKTMSDNIPFDIQREIIKRVPDVKSLLRFRSVSKPWKSLIDSPEFIAGYGTRPTQPHRLLLRYITGHRNRPIQPHRLLLKYLNPYEVNYVSFLDDVTFPKKQQKLDFSPKVPDVVNYLSSATVIGSSCGLWCLYGYNKSGRKMFVFWNPSIRKCVGIVMPCKLTKHFSRNVASYFGFGVSPSTYDPTIVGIFTSFKQIGIFTLSSKSWKMIPISNMLSESIKIRSLNQVTIHRFIFWVAYDAFRYKFLILSFDLITHEFKEINLPDSLPNLNISISKLNESLIVSGATDEVIGQVYELWMMCDEGGAMTSFKKLFTINTPDSSLVRKVLGYKKSGEPILEIKKIEERFTKIKVYDPCSENINDDFGITGEYINDDPMIPREDDAIFVCLYTETLLLSDHTHTPTIVLFPEEVNDGQEFWKYLWSSSDL